MERLWPALNRLVQAGFVRPHKGPIRRNRPTWALNAPMVRFHYAVLGPHARRLRDRPPLDTWHATLRSRFDSQVQGPVCDEVARTWVRRYASQDTLGGVPTAVARHRPPSTASATNSTWSSPTTPPPAASPPSARSWRSEDATAGEPAGRSHLARLERARAAMGPRAATAKLVVSAPAFADDLNRGRRPPRRRRAGRPRPPVPQRLTREERD